VPRPQTFARLEAGGVGFTIRADVRHRALDWQLARWRYLTNQPSSCTPLTYDLLFRPNLMRLVRNGRSLHATRSIPDLLARLEHDVANQVIARTEAAPLHAGAVAFEPGAVVFAGPSGAGKSTLAEALVGLGGVYLGEEQVFAWPGGLVSGLPRVPDSGPPARVAQGHHRVALLVLLERERGPGPLTPLEPAVAAARLAAELHRVPSPDDLTRVTELAAQAPAVVLAHEGVEAAARLLVDRLRVSRSG